MTKKFKNMALASYTKDELDSSKVSRIIKDLSKKDLREYIKALKRLEEKRTLTVFLPSLSLKTPKLENDLKKTFPLKKLVFKEDGSLIAGLKIVDYDNIYNLNIKDTIQDMVSFIAK